MNQTYREAAEQRGQRLAVYALDQHRYAVPSERIRGRAYEVVLEDGVLRCNCHAAVYRGFCKHVAAVDAMVVGAK